MEKIRSEWNLWKFLLGKSLYFHRTKPMNEKEKTFLSKCLEFEKDTKDLNGLCMILGEKKEKK